MEERNNFAKGKVSTHILSIAGPMIVAQLINVLSDYSHGQARGVLIAKRNL